MLSAKSKSNFHEHKLQQKPGPDSTTRSSAKMPGGSFAKSHQWFPKQVPRQCPGFVVSLERQGYRKCSIGW